jgi:hypothetical protein
MIMKKSGVLLVGCIVFSGAVFAVDLSLSPTSLVWTNQCFLDVSISNIAVGDMWI